MSLYDPDREDATVYNVVVNHEEQYSIWADYKEMPLGWKAVGKKGLKPECLAYIKEVWTDMRPLSLRKKMEEMAKNPPLPPRRQIRTDLVRRVLSRSFVKATTG
jgi:MbtH protein